MYFHSQDEIVHFSAVVAHPEIFENADGQEGREYHEGENDEMAPVARIGFRLDGQDTDGIEKSTG